MIFASLFFNKYTCTHLERKFEKVLKVYVNFIQVAPCRHQNLVEKINHSNIQCIQQFIQNDNF